MQESSRRVLRSSTRPALPVEEERGDMNGNGAISAGCSGGGRGDERGRGRGSGNGGIMGFGVDEDVHPRQTVVPRHEIRSGRKRIMLNDYESATIHPSSPNAIHGLLPLE
jgi:outer membrane lipoprotein SlyB